jgi:hypothetical protein
MKKLYFFLLAVGCTLSSFAGDLAGSWIESNEGRIIAKKIVIGETTAKIVMDNGVKKVVSLDQVISYSINGKLFKKLPLYVNGKSTGKLVFMELVNTQGRLNVYRYSDWSYCPFSKINNYLVFSGDSLIIAYDEKSHP